MKTLVAIAALAALGCPLTPAALAQDATAKPGATTPAAPAPPAKQICKREAPSLQTTIPKKICHTQAEWTAMAKAQEEHTKEVGHGIEVDSGNPLH